VDGDRRQLFYCDFIAFYRTCPANPIKPGFHPTQRKILANVIDAHDGRKVGLRGDKRNGR